MSHGPIQRVTYPRAGLKHQFIPEQLKGLAKAHHMVWRQCGACSQRLLRAQSLATVKRVKHLDKAKTATCGGENENGTAWHKQQLEVAPESRLAM